MKDESCQEHRGDVSAALSQRATAYTRQRDSLFIQKMLIPDANK